MAEKFTLAQLRNFVEVAERRSFRQAAASLHMTQPPLTRQIQALERALEVTLIDRSGKRVELTPAGQVLLEDTKRLLQDVSHLKLNVKDVAMTGTRSLNVAYHESAEHDLLPVAVSLFRKEHQEVHLHLVPKGAYGAEEDLVAADVDVALLRPPTRSPEVELTLIRREPLVAVLPVGHRFAGQEIDLVDLRDEYFIGFARTLEDSIQGAVLNACIAAGFSPQYSTKTTSIPMLLSLVAAGEGITLVAQARARDLTLPLGYATLRDRSVSTVLAAAVLRGRNVPLAQAFIDCLLKASRIIDPENAFVRGAVAHGVEKRVEADSAGGIASDDSGAAENEGADLGAPGPE